MRSVMTYAPGKKSSPLPYPFIEEKFQKVSAGSVCSSSDSESAASTGTVRKWKRGQASVVSKKEEESTETASVVSFQSTSETIESMEVDDDSRSATSGRFQQIDEEKTLEVDVAGGSKLNLICMKCETKVRNRSEFLLLPEREDWCGKLWGHCITCSGLKEAEFKKNQRNRWHQRAKEVHGKQGCLRVLQWKKLDSYLKEKMPDASNKQRRAMMSMRLKLMSMAMCLQFFEANEKTRMAYVHVQKEYMAKIDAVCKDIGQPSSQIQHAEADYLTSVAKGIQISYLCRKKDCGFYGMNDQWIQHESKYWFRCPVCGMQYYPWREAEKWYGFQRVLAVSHPQTGEQWVIPALWPSSAEDDYLQKLMVVTASKIETEEDLDNFLAGKIQSLDTMLANIGIPACFKKFTLSQDVKDVLSTCQGFGASQYAKIDKDGFWGNILDKKVAEQEPFNEWTEFAALFADLAKAGEQHFRSLKV